MSTKLLKLYDNQISLLGNNRLINLLKLLIQIIPNNDINNNNDADNDEKKNNNNNDIDRNDIIDKVLHDILSLISDNEITKYKNDTEILDSVQFLIKLLSKSDIIINISSNKKSNLKSIKLSSSTEYVIVTKLFIILSKKSIKNDKIIRQIQNENDNELAGMIIQIMGQNNKKNQIKNQNQYKW